MVCWNFGVFLRGSEASLARVAARRRSDMLRAGRYTKRPRGVAQSKPEWLEPPLGPTVNTEMCVYARELLGAKTPETSCC